MYIIVIHFTSRDFYFFLIKVPLHLIPYNDSIYFLLLSKDIFYCNTKKMACIHHFGRGPNQTEKWCVPHHNWPLSLYPLFFDSKSKSNERETGRGVMPKTSWFMVFPSSETIHKSIWLGAWWEGGGDILLFFSWYTESVSNAVISITSIFLEFDHDHCGMRVCIQESSIILNHILQATHHIALLLHT